MQSRARNGIAVGNAQGGSVANNDVSPIFIGPQAGSAYSLTNPWAVGVGSGALSSLNQSQAEVTALGTWACQYLTTGNWSVCLGLHSAGAETTGGLFTVVGNDSARNENGGYSFTGLGNDSVRNGALINVIGIGNGAMKGNGSSVTIGGTVTVGDTIGLQISAANTADVVAPTSKTYSYTVQSGDTLTTIAQALATAIQSNGLQGKQTGMQAWLSPVSGGAATIVLDFPGTALNGWQVTVTPTLSSGATETVTIGTGSHAASVVAIGDNAAYGEGATTFNHSVVVGTRAATHVTTAFNLTCLGDGACPNVTSDHDTVAVGNNAGGAKGGFGNTWIGSYTGAGATTGANNISIGAQAGDSTAQACITSGSGNIQIGVNSCVPSPTANNQMSIGNLLYATGLTGYDGVVSLGNFAIGTTNPQARTDIVATDDGNSWAALRVRGASGASRFTVYPNGSTVMGAAGWLDYAGQSADVAASTLYTPSANGFYCASAVATITQAATTSSTLPSLKLSWTDADTNTVQTYTGSTQTGNTVGSTFNQTNAVCFFAKGGTAITFQTSGYASTGATPMKFSAHARAHFGAN